MTIAKQLQTFTALGEFVQNAKRSLLSPGPLHIIMGNEAADVDSIASAIVLAFAWQNSSKLPTIPVINIPLQDIHLRPDAVIALQLVGLELEDLIFIDSSCNGLKQYMTTGSQLTLVDHNSLAPHQSEFGHHVRAIIDHHADSNSHLNAHPRLIQAVGSCSTLVAELLFKTEMATNIEAARLLTCAILLDTGNLSSAAGKTTSKDVAILTRLRGIAGWNKTDCVSIHQRLKHLRRDVSNFTATNLLRKDLKTFGAGPFQVAIASIGVSPKTLVQRAMQNGDRGLEPCTGKLASASALDSVIIICRHKIMPGLDERNLAILRGRVGDELQMLLFEEGAGIGLERCHVEGGKGFWWFRLKDSRMSRKAVAPAVTRALEEMAKSSRRMA